MILIDNISNYNFKFGFNQTQDYIIDSLEKEFKNTHGELFYNQCSLIIIVENDNFYHVIRNKHKVRVSGELVSNLCADLQSHL
tara:strand:+ start:158 stop:406 length:249 start_codon:yes stop_codon:yes gene_type:complete